MITRVLFLFLCLRLSRADNPLEKPCSDGCDRCYVGICQHCKVGWFGHDCTSRCNDQCKKDGTCQGIRCNNGCPNGFYGRGCRNYCWCSAGCYQFSGTCKPEPKNEKSDSDEGYNKHSSFPVLIKACAVIASVLVILCVVTVYCRKKTEQNSGQTARTSGSVPRTVNNYLNSTESIHRQPSPRRQYGAHRESGGREYGGYRAGNRVSNGYRQGDRRNDGHSPRSSRPDGREDYTNWGSYDRHSPRERSYDRHSQRERRYDRHSPRERRYDRHSPRERDDDGYEQRDSSCDSGSIHSPRTQAPPTVVIEEPVDTYPLPLAPSAPSSPFSTPAPFSHPPPSSSPPPPPPPPLSSYSQSHSFMDREPPPAYSSLFPSGDNS